MVRFFKLFFSFIIVSMLTVLATSNFNLYHKPTLELIQGDSLNSDLIKQLHALENAFANHADEDMQNLYPEGYIFMNVLYGLAWSNAIEKINPHHDFFIHGHEQIREAIDRIDSERGKSFFDETLPLEYGAFYTGWSTYLLGKKLKVEPIGDRSADDVNLFKSQCEKIALAFRKKTFPASYDHGTWPADATLCAASLSLHDRVFEKKYADVLEDWIAEVKSNLDENGLIPHSVDKKNRLTESARGSSMSLMLIFLKDINADFARQQFDIYRDKFVDSRLGLAGIREYPKGDFGIGDVDSGPVIFQMGGAATIVGMQTLDVYGDHETSARIRSTIEACGFPISKESERFYLFNQLPMADAFIAWGHSAMEIEEPENKRSFLKFHLYSMGAGVLLLLVLGYFWKRKA
jgi:hypothetical protein